MDFQILLTAVITNGIGAACAAAVLWFSWYRETKTIPGMLKTFADALDAGQRSFAERNGQTLKAFGDLAREERGNYQRWHEENRGRLEQLTVDGKELRHLLRDLGHQMGLRQAVAEAQRGPLPPPPGAA